MCVLGIQEDGHLDKKLYHFLSIPSVKSALHTGGLLAREIPHISRFHHLEAVRGVRQEMAFLMDRYKVGVSRYPPCCLCHHSLGSKRLLCASNHVTSIMDRCNVGVILHRLFYTGHFSVNKLLCVPRVTALLVTIYLSKALNHDIIIQRSISVVRLSIVFLYNVTVQDHGVTVKSCRLH